MREAFAELSRAERAHEYIGAPYGKERPDEEGFNINHVPDLLVSLIFRVEAMLYRDLWCKNCVLKTMKNALFPVLSPRGKLTLPETQRAKFCAW